MAAIIEVTDLPTALQSVDMIADMVAGANAKASRVAPCLDSTSPAPSAGVVAEARLILLGAVKRWAESGSGALQSQNAGPFGMTLDTRQRTGFNLWPTEIADLQNICKAVGQGGAFSIDTVGTGSGVHLPWCDLMLGGVACSCGADLNNYEAPLYEGGVLTGDEY